MKLQNQDISNQILSSEIEYQWYLDMISVNSGAFDPLDSTLFVATIVDRNNSNLYKVYAFTTKSGFIAFGDNNGFDHRGVLEYNTLIEIEHENGTFTEERANQIYDRVFRSEAGARSLLLIGHDFCDGKSDGNPIVSIFKVMPNYGSFKNRTSAISGPISIYIGYGGYDKTWFRRYLGTFWSWGGPGFQQCLPWWMDNKIDSSVTWL